ncbi:MAG: hypothetical protein HS122_11710 [Opitutaceae bacterium]|nr:hypothetical protein [Opitutaceae bacterium]
MFLRICPDELLPWYRNPGGVIDIADCYNGDDCWLGPYFWADAHGGLDNQSTAWLRQLPAPPRG